VSEPTDIAALATHLGGAGGAAGVATLLMRWFAGKEATEVATRLALMEQKLDQLVASLLKHEGLGERVALIEASVTAVHERLDGLQSQRRKR